MTTWAKIIGLFSVYNSNQSVGQPKKNKKFSQLSSLIECKYHFEFKGTSLENVEHLKIIRATQSKHFYWVQ